MKLYYSPHDLITFQNILPDNQQATESLRFGRMRVFH